MPTAKTLNCCICRTSNEEELAIECTTCGKLTCNLCSPSACPCPGADGLHGVLKSEIRTEALKAGMFRAATRKRLLSGLEERQMRMHMERVASLTEEFIPLDDRLNSQAA